MTESSAYVCPSSERFVRLSTESPPTPSHNEPRIHAATLEPSLKSTQIVTNNNSADGTRTELTVAERVSSPGVRDLKPQELHLVVELLSRGSDGEDINRLSSELP
jgi:hypothetical protein